MRHDDDVRSVPAGSATVAAPQVAPLKELKDYTVAKDDPDVRRWEVIAHDGRRIGKVNDLLVDTAAMRVRYLDVELDRDLVAAVANAPAIPGTAEVIGAHARPGMAGAGPVVDPRDDRAAWEHHVLVPIGTARLDEDHDRIYLDALDSNDVAVLPAYDPKAFSREYETGVRRRFDRDYTPAVDRDFYAGEIYDEERFYGPRRRRRRLL